MFYIVILPLVEGGGTAGTEYREPSTGHWFSQQCLRIASPSGLTVGPGRPGGPGAPCKKQTHFRQKNRQVATFLSTTLTRENGVGMRVILTGTGKMTGLMSHVRVVRRGLSDRPDRGLQHNLWGPGTEHRDRAQETHQDADFTQRSIAHQ